MEINNIDSYNNKIDFNHILEEERTSLINDTPTTQSKVWKAVDNYLDLGTNTTFFSADLSKEEIQQSLKIIAKLIKKGIVGYNYYEVNGRIEKHFLVPSIGDQRLASAEIVPSHYFDEYY